MGENYNDMDISPRNVFPFGSAGWIAEDGTWSSCASLRECGSWKLFLGPEGSASGDCGGWGWWWLMGRGELARGEKCILRLFFEGWFRFGEGGTDR